MLPTEVFAVVRQQCAESSEEFWTDSEIYSLISLGERNIARKINLCEKNSSFSAVTSTKVYTVASVLSATVGAIYRIEYDSYPLQQISLNELDNYEGTAYGGVSVMGQPTHYYRYGGEIGFSPTPDSDKLINVYFNAIPEYITSSSVSFTIPNQYSDPIVDFALYRMYLKDQELKSESIAHKQVWEEGLQSILSEWNDVNQGRTENTVYSNNPEDCDF